MESASFPTLTRGRYSYDYADTTGWAPLLKMYTLGRGFLPPRIRAGGMRYHGMSPLVSALYQEKTKEARAYEQRESF